MTRKEKYQYLRTLGLSAELARKWRDRKIVNLETKDKNVILKNNSELRREYNNYMYRKRYNFLRSMGVSSTRARNMRKHKKINVENLTLRNNKIVKDINYYKLVNKVKKDYPKINVMSIESKIYDYVKKYKNIENYGVYTKWGTLTRIEPYKHETNELVAMIKNVFNANEKQAYYILYLMYEHGQTLEQIMEIITSDPLYEIYRKNR